MAVLVHKRGPIGGIFMICNESDGTDTTGLKFEKIIDGMKNYTVEQIEAAWMALSGSALLMGRK